MHGVEVVDEPAGPVLEHLADLDVVADPERQVDVGVSIGRAVGERADDGAGDDAVVRRRLLEDPLPECIPLRNREHWTDARCAPSRSDRRRQTWTQTPVDPGWRRSSRSSASGTSSRSSPRSRRRDGAGRLRVDVGRPVPGRALGGPRSRGSGRHRDHRARRERRGLPPALLRLARRRPRLPDGVRGRAVDARSDRARLLTPRLLAALRGPRER